ncbi:hypothetical protein PINS_up021948 [Pythium insidiosum]|nr:hypothetical protein PINS_up021948 [Pythium insidiosum]
MEATSEEEATVTVTVPRKMNRKTRTTLRRRLSLPSGLWEKIDVHYERVAKRVDVKKLKTSIWSHLENDSGILGAKTADASSPPTTTSDEVVPAGEDVAHNDESGTPSTTTFENVVHSVSDSVPSNVTVSFYFICMLHLANEKGLKLIGQEDMSNFEIIKDEGVGSTSKKRTRPNT